MSGGVDLFVRKDAEVSPCGTYRYLLDRQWSKVPPLLFVMLNPSTADADLDDPTIRRCIGFAQREGAGGICVGNLCALRSRDPAPLATHLDPEGPGNARALGMLLLMSAVSGMPVVAAWGACPAVNDRAKRLAQRAADFDIGLFCLGRTKEGHPRHPLYVRADQPLERWPA